MCYLLPVIISCGDLQRGWAVDLGGCSVRYCPAGFGARTRRDEVCVLVILPGNCVLFLLRGVFVSSRRVYYNRSMLSSECKESDQTSPVDNVEGNNL